MADLKAAGVTDVFRYVGPSSWGKTITQPEYAELMDAGIRVYVVFEGGPDDSSGGTVAGITNAQTALAWLPTGYPEDYPIFMAADEDLEGQALVTATEYITGASMVLNPTRTGDYGPGALCQATHDAGVARVHWQSASTSFNGNATTLPITQVQQGLAGPLPDTDLDTILAPLVVPPAPQQKAKDNMQVTDPTTGGVWCLRMDGSIWGYAQDGSQEPPWLGGLNTSVGKGVNLANISGISLNESPQGPGYTIGVDNGAQGFALYAFTRDGKFAHL